MHIEAFGITDKGMVRKNNEDAFLSHEKDGIFLIADGMGGLSKGDVASRTAIETIENFIKKSRVDDVTWPIKPIEEFSMEENRFLAAISLANWRIYEQYLNGSQKATMGTTLVGLLVDGEHLVMANIGDSRAYLVRDNTIRQLTEDHSLVMEEVRKGSMTLEEAKTHPQKHVITRALGISEVIEADITAQKFQAGDLYLLCSDGLSDMIPDEEMISLLQSNSGKPLKVLGENLIKSANNQGGLDNMTVVLVTMTERDL